MKSFLADIAVLSVSAPLLAVLFFWARPAAILSPLAEISR